MWPVILTVLAMLIDCSGSHAVTHN